VNREVLEVTKAQSQALIALFNLVKTDPDYEDEFAFDLDICIDDLKELIDCCDEILT